MFGSFVEHVRRHVIGYIALVCALLSLGGAAYAQIRIPNGAVGQAQLKKGAVGQPQLKSGAVGERQLQNHVIDPVKWDTNYTTGFIRRWATVNANGLVVTTSPGGQSKPTTPGKVNVTWGDGFAGWCAPIATVIGGSATPAPAPPTTTTTSTTTTTTTPTTTAPPPNTGYADAKVVTRTGQSTLVAVSTFNSRGRPTALPFSVAVICGPGAGSGQSLPTNLP